MTSAEHTSAQTPALDLPYLDAATPATVDLFKHVNGAWLRDHEIPQDRSGDGAMRELFDGAEAAVRELITALSQPTDSQPAGPADSADSPTHAPGSPEQQVADLYASFMDTDTIAERGLSPLAEDFATIKAAADKSALAEVLGRLERTGTSGPVAIYVDADAKDSAHYALYTHQGGIHLPDEVYYSSEDYAEIREQYREHIARMSALAGLSVHTGYSDAELAEQVLAFETAVAAHHWDRVRTRDAEAGYNPKTAAEAVELAAGFDFAAWLTGAGLETVERMIVGQPDFLTGLGAVWQETDLQVLRAWALFSVLEENAALLTDEISRADFEFFGRALSGTPEQRERWKRGVSIVESLLGQAVGKLYVAQHFPPQSKARIAELVDKLVEAYEHSIKDLDWMGPDTKVRALEKLGLFGVKVGYPDVWRSYDFTVVADDLVGNVRRASVAEYDRLTGRIGGEIDREEWLMTPQTVNAYYHPVLNEIVFPAAILQAPFFDPQASDAANFGAVGAVIGHEIGHGFDDQGSRYDGHGNLVDWWTAEDRARFEERTSGLIAQYDALVPEGFADEPKFHVNGGLTIGENIGDLGGLSIAWKALHLAAAASGTEVTAQDAHDFFCSWANAWRAKFRPAERERRLSIDPHAPEEFRCNQIVKNIDAFADFFGVTEADPMWLAPEERVTIW
ncbi:peptidase M13 [Brevibacterium sp. 91QC2O2]|uniref:M13 family metallopeptidase n=1 Tax=Brevibacterium sp. 91QC2O2 TaxID=2968458 RepID=UPI00211CA5B1|nr:M13-type metalloendopeptidase [Brevibacterium sp. 91QC2O2]MCQ9369593.1 peptidase M13 [Brevibacterium sp. 91QC2O2]